MSTHNIWFHGEIRNILCGYPLLSAAMLEYVCSHKQSVVSREGICNNNIYKKNIGKTLLCKLNVYSRDFYIDSTCILEIFTLTVCVF